MTYRNRYLDTYTEYGIRTLAAIAADPKLKARLQELYADGETDDISRQDLRVKELARLLLESQSGYRTAFLKRLRRDGVI